jgi:flagellar L-ring protein precursor FlgH
MRALALICALFAAGCASTRDPMPVAPEPVVYPQPATPRNGSLFNTGSPVALFADQRARQPGDMLTIVLQERTQARTSAATATSKSGNISLPGPTLFGRPVTAGGTPIMEAQVGTDREFSGAGSSEQANQLDGFITVQVLEVTPNGLLRVQGEKRLRINRGDETIVLTGLVRPQDIAPDNTVPSARVANAEIEYAGRGALGDANRPGWASRFFSSVLWPF